LFYPGESSATSLPYMEIDIEAVTPATTKLTDSFTIKRVTDAYNSTVSTKDYRSIGTSNPNFYNNLLTTSNLLNMTNTLNKTAFPVNLTFQPPIENIMSTTSGRKAALVKELLTTMDSLSEKVSKPKPTKLFMEISTSYPNKEPQYASSSIPQKLLKTSAISFTTPKTTTTTTKTTTSTIAAATTSISATAKVKLNRSDFTSTNRVSLTQNNLLKENSTFIQPLNSTSIYQRMTTAYSYSNAALTEFTTQPLSTNNNYENGEEKSTVASTSKPYYSTVKQSRISMTPPSAKTSTTINIKTNTDTALTLPISKVIDNTNIAEILETKFMQHNTTAKSHRMISGNGSTMMHNWSKMKMTTKQPLTEKTSSVITTSTTSMSLTSPKTKSFHSNVTDERSNQTTIKQPLTEKTISVITTSTTSKSLTNPETKGFHSNVTVERSNQTTIDPYKENTPIPLPTSTIDVQTLSNEKTPSASTTDATTTVLLTRYAASSLFLLTNSSTSTIDALDLKESTSLVTGSSETTSPTIEATVNYKHNLLHTTTDAATTVLLTTTVLSTIEEYKTTGVDADIDPTNIPLVSLNTTTLYPSATTTTATSTSHTVRTVNQG